MLMPLRTLFISLGLVLLFFEPLFSQKKGISFSGNNGVMKVKNYTETDYKKNLLKVDLVKLAFGGINLSYERVLTQRSAINFRAKYHSLGFIERSVDDFSTSGENYTFGLSDRPHFHAIGFDAEYRFYLKSKKAAQGFYIAPYTRYLNYSGAFESFYSGTVAGMPVNIDGDLKTSFNIWGGGVQLGIQWLVKDKVSIDWGFAGLGLDHYQFKVEVQSDYLSDEVDEYTRDLQDVMGGVSGFLAKKLIFNTLDNELSSKVPFWMVGWKSTLTVGIAF